jgi:hypothetical protein
MTQVDTLPEEVRAKAVKKATKLLHQTLVNTKFGKAPVFPVAAKPGASCCCCCCCLLWCLLLLLLLLLMGVVQGEPLQSLT